MKIHALNKKKRKRITHTNTKQKLNNIIIFSFLVGFLKKKKKKKKKTNKDLKGIRRTRLQKRKENLKRKEKDTRNDDQKLVVMIKLKRVFFLKKKKTKIYN